MNDTLDIAINDIVPVGGSIFYRDGTEAIVQEDGTLICVDRYFSWHYSISELTSMPLDNFNTKDMLSQWTHEGYDLWTLWEDLIEEAEAEAAQL